MKPLVALAFALAAFAAQAFELRGTHAIVLGNAGGARVVIGKVSFSAQDDGRSRFVVSLDPALEEYFLAMRPFRCVSGPQQRLCHFPVEREPPLVSPNDLVPLEYALMFMRTAPNALHVNPFNGVYYRLRLGEAGISGRLHELDMDPFITPDSVPAERRRRPVRPQDLSLGDEASHWLPHLSIE